MSGTEGPGQDTIVFFNINASGHVNPSLPLVREFVGRGFRVIYYTYAEWKKKIEALGATCRPYGSDSWKLRDLHPCPQYFDAHPFSIFNCLYSIAPALVEMLLPEIVELRPLCIVSDMAAPWGTTIARHLGIPAIGLLCSYSGSEKLKDRELDVYSKEGIDTLNNKYNAKVGWFPMCQRGDFNIVYSVRELYGGVMPKVSKALTDMLLMITKEDEASLCFVGSMTERQEDLTSFPWEKLGNATTAMSHHQDPKRRKVYVSMGTVVPTDENFFNQILEQFEECDIQLIISVGTKVKASAFTSTKHLIFTTVPQLELLKHVDLFVTHGGFNSINEALALGVPMVVIPHVGDQHVNANFVVNLGAGKQIEKEELHNLRSVVDDVLSHECFKLSAQKLAEAYKGLGPAYACDSILKRVTLSTTPSRNRLN